MPEKKSRFGLTPAEYENLMQAARYGIAIIIAILITFAVVASITRLTGYTPPSPNVTLTPSTLGE